MDARQAWMATLGQLQMDMPKATYDTWVKGTELIEHNKNSFSIGVQNAYARDWLENRLTTTAEKMLTGIMDAPQTVSFLIRSTNENAPLEEEIRQPIVSSPEKSQRALPTKFNSRYTFDNFVVGPNNRLPHAASQAVAESPAHAYNPLFLYGGVGLGKTHLLQAIGNDTSSRDLNVLYVSSEEFTNDLINSIRRHDTESFRERYRSIDVLLVDDIQFIAGKESTQEEFFHTFNTLHGQNKQIVISSDRSPKSLVTLEERLRSRFEWGLIVDIQPPELETRIAILRTKADRAGRIVPDEILENIAHHIQSNIRELEGALTRVLAYSDLSGKPLTLELTKIALTDFLPIPSSVDPDQILEVVADTFNLTREEILSRNRSKKISLPRQIAMYLLRDMVNASFPHIGDRMGGRDHTTVLYACEKIADLIERDDLLRRQVFQIRDQLYKQTAFV
ncbi:MAG: chromosomal replication initiator protein DnaA [Pelolinea sp.]|nr:chromosomal replication initiator protein DnaA [Pelolinea sp.]